MIKVWHETIEALCAKHGFNRAKGSWAWRRDTEGQERPQMLRYPLGRSYAIAQHVEAYCAVTFELIETGFDNTLNG